MPARIAVPDLGLELKKQPDLTNPAVRERLSCAAIEGVLKIAEKWNLKSEEVMALLGGISNGRYYDLKRTHKGILTQDELTRVSLLIGIFRALNTLFHEKLADQWISRRNSNPMFNNAPPLLRMIELGIPGMMAVRRLLESRVNGG